MQATATSYDENQANLWQSPPQVKQAKLIDRWAVNGSHAGAIWQRRQEVSA